MLDCKVHLSRVIGVCQVERDFHVPEGGICAWPEERRQWGHVFVRLVVCWKIIQAKAFYEQCIHWPPILYLLSTSLIQSRYTEAQRVLLCGIENGLREHRGPVTELSVLATCIEIRHKYYSVSVEEQYIIYLLIFIPKERKRMPRWKYDLPIVGISVSHRLELTLKYGEGLAISLISKRKCPCFQIEIQGIKYVPK